MNKKYKQITGFVLAGGYSKRMGLNKALLKVRDKTIIERSHNLMLQVFENVLLSTNDFESYRFLGLPMVADIYKGLGPLSGIHAGLVASETNNNFFLSCDLPLMSEEMIRFITEYKTARSISISSAGGRDQHLCGIYNKSLIPVIEDILRSSNNSENENGKSSSSVKNLILNSGAEIIKADILPFYKEDIYFNMNTIDDFEFIKKKILG
jgi:molybdopterin-guanine dinucleotide biosynthesis protein A